MPPLVSIGLPVYNGARTLERVLESLLQQTHRELEIVLSDNGSTDATPAIAQTFAARHANLRVVRSDENRGAVWNFNRVVELARGDYFMWAAHDDERDLGYVERTLARLQASPSAAVCHSYIEMVDAEGRTQYIQREPLRAEEDDARRRWLRTLEPLHWQFVTYGLIRRAALDRTQLVRNYYGSDLGLVSELALQGRILQIEEPLFRYHLRQEDRVDLYIKRLLPSLHPDNRYRPLVPLRAIAAREHLRAIDHARLSWRERARMTGDLARWFLFGRGMRDELLRLATEIVGPDRVARIRRNRRG
jgi:glycosyltransferase involved in cell wall biosynthesis